MANLKRVGTAGAKAAQEGLYARWEISAPLSEKESDMIMDLAALVTDRPLPKHLPANELFLDTTSQSHLHTIDRENSVILDYRKDSVVADSGAGEAGHGPGIAGVEAPPPDKVETSHAFFTWFAEVENEMDGEQEAGYRRHLAVMQSYLAVCDAMLDDVDKSRAFLDTLTEQHDFVSKRTESLHTACEQLLSDQTQLVQFADSIGVRLQHFLELDRVTLKLNSPALHVLSAAFVPILHSLDSSIAYVSAHREYRDAETYLVKFQQLQSKALVLVKISTVEMLKTAAQDSKDALAKGTDTFTACYAKFGTRAPPIKALMDELGRWSTKYREYEAVLADCHACYFGQRQQLTAPIIYAKMAQLNAAHADDLPSWVRAGSSFLQRICHSETQLYHRFFPAASDGLNDLLEALTDILYDHVRPIAIKLNDVNMLAELCDIISTEILSESATSNSSAAFYGAMQQILEDIQARLVYRMQAYIRTDIGLYQPTDADLDYPGKLVRAAASRPLSRQGSTASTGGAAATGSGDADVYSTWYVPLHRTLMALSLLYRCLEKSVFEGIAQDAVSTCRDALERAAVLIEQKHSKADGQLFLIKHLLTFREQIAPFDADFVANNISLDFNTTKAAAYGLVTSASRLFSIGQRNAVLNFLLDGVPAVREQRVDSKKDLDMRLKVACEAYIQDTTARLLGPVAPFLDQVSGFAYDNAGGSKGTLPEQPWASPEKVAGLASDALAGMQATHAGVLQQLRVYLRNKETEFILFKPIKKAVVDQYRTLHKIVADNYTPDDQLIIGLTPAEHVSLLLTMPTSTAP